MLPEGFFTDITRAILELQEREEFIGYTIGEDKNTINITLSFFDKHGCYKWELVISCLKIPELPDSVIDLKILVTPTENDIIPAHLIVPYLLYSKLQKCINEIVNVIRGWWDIILRGRSPIKEK